MTIRFPQFAQTSDPRVLATIQRNIDGFHEFNLKGSAVAKKYTGSPIAGRFNGSLLRGAVFTGLSTEHVPDTTGLPGQWKKPENGAIMPYKSNPVIEEFNIEFKAEHTPGRGNILWGDGHVGTGQLFVHDGVAYSYFTFKTEPLDKQEAAEMVEHGWTEILPSAYHLAYEAVQAAEMQSGALA